MSNRILGTGLTYDDVQLVPEKSSLESRLDANIGTSLGRIHLAVPIVSSPMDTVTNGTMARAMGEIGGLGIIHRYQSIAARAEEIQIARPYPVGVAVGINDDIEDIVRLVDAENGAQLVLIDVAHAHHTSVLSFSARLSERIRDRATLMVGNVATRIGAIELLKAGADVIRIGIGGGSICTTRLVTGFGVPNITAIMDAREAVDKWSPLAKVVADGGIKTSGDMAKALAAGAHAVMLGSMLAGTLETPGEIFAPKGDGVTLMKAYRGMASRDAQSGWKPLKAGTSPEGISSAVPYRGEVGPILQELAGGLRSAFSYAGARNLKEFYDYTEFVQVTSAGMAEAQAHIKNRAW